MVTDRGPFVLLDIGATTDSTGLNLAQYARMGAIYAEQVLGVQDPTVALLSIGEEGGKGEQRVQEATALIQATDLRFLGNVEGRDLPEHPADVVVCDASVGNVTIKFFEGLSSAIFDTAARRVPAAAVGPASATSSCARASRASAAGSTTSASAGRRCSGCKGTVLITHGRAKRRMIGFAVGVGAAAARARIPELIAAALAPGIAAAAEAKASGGAADAARTTTPPRPQDRPKPPGPPRRPNLRSPTHEPDRRSRARARR